MFKIKQDQIFMICEGLLFLFIAYSVFKYVRSLNTKINKVNNRLNMLETFIQQSNITINSSLVKEKFEEKEKTKKESETEAVTKQVKFDIPKPQVINENELIEMIEQSFIHSQQSSHSPDKIEEIPEHTNTTSFSETNVEENIVEVQEEEENISEEDNISENIVEVQENIVEVQENIVEEVDEEVNEEVQEEVNEEVEEVDEEVEEEVDEEVDEVDEVDEEKISDEEDVMSVD